MDDRPKLADLFNNPRKRKKHESEWKRSKAKQRRNSGEGRGGGGGTQIWFRRGCAAEAAKPVPIFKGQFGGKGKGYPLLGVIIQENDLFCVL